ncbi:MAG TPA: class I SAM-dependent methyltransferase [Marmoricola sp.]|nr:class I SAM-dependent methyltransferase [Marmoricola sp.]
MPIDVPLRKIDEIPGWFQRMDMAMFRHLLAETEERLGGGDLAELGAYLGKSAALIGCATRPGETFTVIDLFEGEAADADNQAENDEQYATLSQTAFERWYRTVHDELPVVVRGPSQQIVDHAGHGTHRFVHVDASHLYEHVVGDIEAARTLLKPGGIVVFDDFRAPHTPGVAAAVWRATTEDLVPFAVTQNKLYASFGDDQRWVDVVRDWLTASHYWRMEVQQVAGHELVRMRKPAPKTAPKPAATSSNDERRRGWRNVLGL